MWSNTDVAGMCTGQFVRNRKSTRSRSGPTTLPYMRVNSFVRFDNPHLKQQRFQGTVFVSLRITTICFFSALPSSFSTWRRLHLILRVTFIRTGDTINLIYTNDIDVYFPIRSMGAGVAGTHAEPLYTMVCMWTAVMLLA